MSDARHDVVEATRYQRMAADPRATRLASANAGSGKTKVLVERVSRLLLDGADPDKILCLTYTKAAASEMQTRLFDTLGSWSVMPEDELNAELDKVLGERIERDAKTLGNARQLFARALETPDGLKVQTIHAFCERVLSRFPIEAGILPGFEPMDDVDGAVLRTSIEEDIYRAARAEPESELAASLRLLASKKADMSLEGLFKWMATGGEAIRLWLENGGLVALAKTLGVSQATTVNDQYVDAWNDIIKSNVKQAALALLESGNVNDVTKANTMLAAITEPDPVAGFEAYAGIILKKDGGLRKSVITASAPEMPQAFFGTTKNSPTAEATRVFQAVQNILAAECLEMTRAVFTIAVRYAQDYEQAKRARRWLDFNDQILLVRNLLVRSEVADWVRYKLDGGIGHILVDEAQDTAPDQWAIIDALKEGFNAQDPAWPHDKEKTFFAVGDEKQSIYSFQGARPEKFIDVIRKYVDGDAATSIRMRMSFRSAPDVLRVVDGVFADQKGLQRMFDAENVDIASEIVTHTAFREDRGLVELWPLAPRPEATSEEKPWDPSPVDALDQSSSRERLAREIARKIKRWLENGEPIYDREIKATRPMQAGDILILVRGRNEFFEAVIRNMKLIGVPVAGADRLVLKDSVAVKDLLALTRFVLLPADDLSLAEVLKSPLFEFTEDELFQTAKRRGKLSLWQSLQAQDFGKALDATAALNNIRSDARRFAPYEFYARILDGRAMSGESRLKRIYARLGAEAKDTIEAFLSRALAHQRRGAPSLQHFLQSFAGDSQDIKREMDAGHSEVRVMTVHGAKGLEAPVVFLPDTTQTPNSKSGSGLVNIGGTYAYLPSKDSTPDALTSIREKMSARDKEEYMRLLYVAMTRAESRLIVCGFESGHRNGKGYSTGSWYDELCAAMAGLEVWDINTPFEDGQAFGAYALTPENVSAAEQNIGISLPPWMNHAAPRERTARRYVTPSHLLAAPSAYDMPVRSPVSGGPDRFLRGNIIHKLLEILPDMNVSGRTDAAKAYLESYPDLSDDLRETIYGEVFAVLDHPGYAPIFAPGSRAEVSLAGRSDSLPKGLYLNAQIDRLAVTDDSVFIIDYKSNRPPPQHQDDVPDIYWGQMAAYRELARNIYPERDVRCGLLWTDGPSLMILDTNRLDHALTLIAELPT